MSLDAFLFVWSMMKRQNATPKKQTTQDIFLETFALHGNVLRACEAAGINRSTLYRWKEHSNTFLLRFNQAYEDAKDNIRDEVYRRAHDGVEEPVYQSGMKVGTITKFSDTLLIFHAKMLMPEYRDQSKVDVTANVTTQGAGSLTLDLRNATQEELQQLKALALNMKARQG